MIRNIVVVVVGFVLVTLSPLLVVSADGGLRFIEIRVVPEFVHGHKCYLRIKPETRMGDCYGLKGHYSEDALERASESAFWELNIGFQHNGQHYVAVIGENPRKADGELQLSFSLCPIYRFRLSGDYAEPRELGALEMAVREGKPIALKLLDGFEELSLEKGHVLYNRNVKELTLFGKKLQQEIWYRNPSINACAPALFNYSLLPPDIQ